MVVIYLSLGNTIYVISYAHSFFYFYSDLFLFIKFNYGQNDYVTFVYVVFIACTVAERHEILQIYYVNNKNLRRSEID